MRLLRNQQYNINFMPDEDFHVKYISRGRGDPALNKNESNHLISSIVIIQHAWREYLNRRRLNVLEPLGKVFTGDRLADCDKLEVARLLLAESREKEFIMSGDSSSKTSIDSKEDLANSEPVDAGLGSNGVRLPAGSTDDSSSLASHLLHLDSSDASKFLPISSRNRHGIESDPDSIVSDYSEINEPIREHLASVQIIRREDLDLGNAFPSSPRRVTVATTLRRELDEDDEAYERRIRKTNLLSLAQEFAALKRVNADALPFDLHKERFLQSGESKDDDTISDNDSDNLETPMSEIPPTGFPSLSDKLVDFSINGASKKVTDKMEGKDVPDVVPTGPFRESGVKNSPVRGFHGRSSVSPLRAGLRTDSPKRCVGEEAAVDSSVEEFDVYTMESTLPTMDWQRLEEQLMKSAEDEQNKWSRTGDRDEIRRKLAMSVDDEYLNQSVTVDNDFTSLHRRPNLQSRLQTGMALQVCYVNDAAIDHEVLDSTLNKSSTAMSGSSPQPDVVPENHMQTVGVSLNEGGIKDGEEGEDFFSRQALLQEEAKLALAQVRPMAHMQLQLEKQFKKKSPIAEIIGIPNFTCEKLKQINRQILTRMNLAQLQVVVNDLHAQIEVLNSDLMQLLVDRDELHMAQDSMLVDIEDLTGRAKEYADRINKRALKKCAGK